MVPDPHLKYRDLTDEQYTQIQARIGVLLTVPAVAAIHARAAALTEGKRAALHTAWITHFRLSRQTQGDIWHRCRRLYGDNWRDLLRAEEEIRRAVNADGEGVWGAAHAAADAARGVLLRQWLTDDEWIIQTGPWRDVTGPIHLTSGPAGPPACWSDLFGANT